MSTTLESKCPASDAGTVKHQNVCKCHISLDTGFKQSERAFFLQVVSMWKKFDLLFNIYLKKLYAKIVNEFLKIVTHKSPVFNFGVAESQYSDKC